MTHGIRVLLQYTSLTSPLLVKDVCSKLKNGNSVCDLRSSGIHWDAFLEILEDQDKNPDKILDQLLQLFELRGEMPALNPKSYAVWRREIFPKISYWTRSADLKDYDKLRLAFEGPPKSKTATCHSLSFGDVYFDFVLKVVGYFGPQSPADEAEGAAIGTVMTAYVTKGLGHAVHVLNNLADPRQGDSALLFIAQLEAAIPEEELVP